jgi:hypothetical protein
MTGKTTFVQLRMSPELKERMAAAALSTGKSISSFITEAVMIAIVEAERPKRKGVHQGVPTFFRACCDEATAGGPNGYSIPGYHLASSVGSEIPADLTTNEWAVEVDRLCELLKRSAHYTTLRNDDADAVWKWFCNHFPKMMNLVPKRRRGAFLHGVKQAYDEERIEH